MQRKVILAALAVVLGAALFGAGRAYAASCYTDFNSVVACWMKANGIAAPYANGSYKPASYLTRGDAAAFLYKANRVPPPAGDFYLVQPLSALTVNAYSPLASISHYANAVSMDSSAAATMSYEFYLTFPTSVYGRATRFKGVQLCYDAQSYAGVSLTGVDLELFNMNALGAQTIVNELIDFTVRTDATCRRYLFTTPSLTSASNWAAVTLSANFSSTSQHLLLLSVSAILAPTTQAAVLNAADAGAAP